ncbi:uncharacterized protein [Parasteatoda tepidariorum]|uniref:uncharacterized protein n=1 Tax=Parasteatoda tepidariorum TaxID=114398 RepID=UPI001C717FFD|nr:uncharacterized protein LOC122269587 [Parasteatoda tepidariorum]
MEYSYGIFIVIAFVVIAASGDVGVRGPLITMQKDELLKIIDCINVAENPTLCKYFNRCEQKMAEPVQMVFHKCISNFPNEGSKQCAIRGGKMFSSMEIPSMIYDCLRAHTPKLTAEDAKQMIDFETCARELHVGTCKYNPFVPTAKFYTY